MLNFHCNHFMCSNCLANLQNSDLPDLCPFCRRRIVVRQKLNFSKTPVNIFLGQLSQRRIPNNEKCIPNPISEYEMEVLKYYFGDFSEKRNIDELAIQKKILIQCYSSDCWYIGTLIDSSTNNLKLDDCICISRCNGLSYKTQPKIRKIDFCGNDKLFECPEYNS